MFNYEEMKNKIILADCMDIMKDIPDKWFELAIVDPPYGINRSANFGKAEYGWKQYKRSKWDSSVPNKIYFDELFRISQNQIIWGGNYMVNYISPSMGWVCWDKGQRNFSTSDGELAWTSFNQKLRIYGMSRAAAFINNDKNPIHPTQKPIALYRWLLQNYAKPGDKIIDTHSGSGSLACACHLEKYDFIAIEKDPEYHALSVKRLEELRSQGVLF